ncbi:contractile injection system tape measure protein [Sphingomonas sp. QA11]|uniref:contractile injection system tape measure protein n=1 Tax=Sphingomonas sp. QA11 TaxID=2950605 RepID=UPI00234B05D4|nr:contractile injection system tape measure protein [Sphingomonas sp. QA11]WCM25657.1 contractile injection system tape measure protein [Sphingomonas sp. QA11]
MPPRPHHVERLTLDIDLAGLGSALTLRARAEEMSRTLFPTALERILDSLVPADLLLRLDRIDLDLGSIAAERMEEEVSAALEHALTEAIGNAVAAARHAADDAPGATMEKARLEDFDTYLLHGAPRFHSAADPFDPAGSLRQLIAERPGALVATLRRLARYRHALERLVLQAAADDLRALLTILAPADVAVILTYHTDLRRLYLQTPAPLAEPVLRRALWVLTLEFLLRDAGTQSNRRAFVDHLIQGIAVAEGIAYPVLLGLLREALHRTRRQRPITGSLPGVIEDLFARRGDDAATDTLSDAPMAAQPAAGTETRDLETLLARLRAAVGNPVALEALVRGLTARAFAWLVERLEPAHAALIIAYVHGLTLLHHEAALLALSDAGFERQVRLLVLRYLLRDAGTQFNRRSWLRRLLRGLAAAGGVSYAFLLETLVGTLAILRQPAGSLPLAVADLAADLPPVAPGDQPAADPDKVAMLLSGLRRHGQDQAATATLLQGLSASDFRRLVERLRPGHAAAILADLDDLAKVQRGRSLFGLSDTAFEQQLRRLALRSLLAEPPPPFHRLAWLRQLLRNLAPAIDTDHARLLASLAEAGSTLARDSILARALSQSKPVAVPTTAETVAGTTGDPTALARQLSQADGAGKLGLLRWLAGDIGLLRRVVAISDDTVLVAALGAFGRAHAAVIEPDLALLLRWHSAAPQVRLDADRFRHLIWTLALATLARGNGRLDQPGMRRALIAGLARHDGIAIREIGEWRSLAAITTAGPVAGTTATNAPAEMPADQLLRFAEHFLRTGQPLALGPRLPEAANRDPDGFAALLHRLTTAASGETRVLIDRLLTWMLPEEILEALQPDLVDRAATIAGHLADRPGGTMTDAWTRILDAVLLGKDPELIHPPGAPGERQDRLALLTHWLDQGTLPWWAPPEARIATWLGDLAGETVAVLRKLFDDPDPELVSARLRRILAHMKPADGATLLQRLAPWAFASSGPLAALSAGLNGRALEDLRIRAAVAAMAGAALDMARLARPVPMPPDLETTPPTPPGRRDRSILFAWLSGAGPADPPTLARLLRLLADMADRGDPALDTVLRDGLARPEARARWAAAMPGEILARIVHRIAPARARFVLDLTAILATARRQAAPSGASDNGEQLWSLVLTILAERETPAPRVIAARMIAAIAKDVPDSAPRVRAQATLVARQGGHANIVAALQRDKATETSRPPARAEQQAERRMEPDPPPPMETGAMSYVRNAGLVLFNPFLPLFFERLGVLTAGTDGIARITGIESISRAVHLLQYLVDERCDRPEPDLILNKLLCGADSAAPVARSIVPDAGDRAICDEMVRAMIGNWPIVRNTSPAGLRETFLQRDGRLRREEDRWTLDVERKTVDVLTDQIPWNRAVLYHRWMPQPLHVNW